MRRWMLAAGFLLAMPLSAAAAPDPSKPEAQVLVTEGVAHLKARRYPAALAKFQAAYALFPSTKILLNIGTTLKEMGRLAEAANTYQQYVEDPTTPPERVAEVKEILNDLDRRVVLLNVEVLPVGAEVSVDGRPWQPIARTMLTRISPGVRLVRARSAGLQPAEASVTANAGEARRVLLTLRPAAADPAPRPASTTGAAFTASPATPERDVIGQDMDTGAGAATSAEVTVHHAGGHGYGDRRFGLTAQGRFDVESRGGAGAVGLVVAPEPHLELEAAALFADSYGAYAGARFRLLPAGLTPHLAVGAPIFFRDGARYAGRVAVGGEVAIGAHLGIVAEVGYEHFFNPQAGYDANVFVPTLGVQGWL